jgi:hypothetical protein
MTYIKQGISVFVILSEAKDLVRWVKMLRCTQHDNTLPVATYRLMHITADYGL